MSELEKMQQGLWYDANYDEELIEKRMQAMDLCFEFNQLQPSKVEEKQILLDQILGYQTEGVTVLSPLTVDYGTNVKLGKNVFVNVNCYFMDGAKITIGDNTFIGPSCGFYTATHPLDYTRRNQGLEKALPITVGKNCWFGGNVVVLPGITIGEGCVIGAGSVVTHDVPDNSVVAGNPARLIKAIQQ